MPPPREITPFQAVGSRRPNAERRGRRSRLSPLAREIIVILVVKAIVLTLLWFAFFRAPAAPGMKMDPLSVEQKMLASPPRPEVPHAAVR